MKKKAEFEMIYMDDNNLVFFLDQEKNIFFLPAKRCLTDSVGNIIELSENSCRFLFLLLSGETDKQSLINQTWYEQKGIVSESSYYSQIYHLRKAFHSIGLSNALIKTLPRKGVKYMGYVKSDLLNKELQQAENENHSDRSLENSNYSKENLDKENNKNTLSRKPKEWYNSRSWNILVSSLAVLSVCWLSTLFVLFVKFVL